MPYGFYTFVRIIVCGCAAFMAYQSYSAKKQNIWPWLLGFVAILFNPVASIHMTKEIWMVVDAVTGGLFAFLAYRKYKEEK